MEDVKGRFSNDFVSAMPEEPLVTVIILVFNTGGYVVEALKSIRIQDYKNIQTIIIDDCSSDNSVLIVTEWIKNNNFNCEYIVHRVNLGITKSLNEGLSKAKGKYITSIGDDLFLPGKFRRQVEIFENLDSSYGVLYSDILMQNDDGDNFGTLFSNYRKDILIAPEGNIFEDLFVGNFIHGSAALIRKECFNSIGFYNESLIVEDIDMYLRIAQKYKFKFDREISAVYRIHGNSLLQTIGTKGLEENLKSLEPYCRHSKNTLVHFTSYLDSCLLRFYSENYYGWKIWYRRRILYKKDIKSYFYYCLALFNIGSSKLYRIKIILSPIRFFKNILQIK